MPISEIEPVHLEYAYYLAPGRDLSREALMRSMRAVQTGKSQKDAKKA
jgi:hypothetical protein